MIEVRPAADTVHQTWAAGWLARLEQRYRQYSRSAPWVDRMVEQHRAERERAAEAGLFELVSAGEVVGTLALAVTSAPPGVSINDVYVDPAHRRRGHARAALEWAKAWASTRAGTITAVTDADDPAQLALFADIPVRAQTMLKDVSEPDPADGALPPVPARPMRTEEFAGWRAARELEYAAQMADSGLLSAPDAAARAAAQFDQLLPDGLASTNQAFWTVVNDAGEPAGAIWLGLHYAPDTSWVYSLDVEARQRGKGYGRIAMLAAEQITRSAGDHQIGLNVFATNAVAIGLYHRLGYRVVLQHRSAQC